MSAIGECTICRGISIARCSLCRGWICDQVCEAAHRMDCRQPARPSPAKLDRSFVGYKAFAQRARAALS